MIGWVSLGILNVAAAGTPVRITANQTDPTARIDCYSILVQQVPGNVGYIVIGQGSAVRYTSFVNCDAILAIPTSNSLPSATAGILTQAETRLNAADYYVDVSESGDNVLCSVLTDENI